MLTATIFDIQRASFVDGPGIRTTVFFKGCHLRCKWCHNPESQNPHPEMMVHKNKCVGCGKCAEVCPRHLASCDLCGKCVDACPHGARQIYGYEKSVDDIFEEIQKDKAFYDTSGGGVTFSGGECMLQIEPLTELLKKCKENEIHTAVDTAGDLPWMHFERILPFTDLFLYDIKCFTDSLHVDGTGISNKRILENLSLLSQKTSVDIIVRIPIIPTFNDDVSELQHIADFLRPLRIRDVELLPYHSMGEHKYEGLGSVFTHFDVPDKQSIEFAKSLFN
jgi:pyruvate formate lyase activating enzyme